MRRTRALTLALGCCLAIATSAPPAQAGVYDVWSCRLPDGSAAPVNGWAPTEPRGSTNSCASAGGGMKAELAAVSGVALPELTAWVFTAPDNLRIDNFTLFRYAQMSGLDLVTYALFYGTPDRQAERCGGGAGCAVLGTDGTAFAPANQVGGQHLDLPRLGAALVCSAGACEPSQVPSFFVVFSARIGLADVRPPTFVRDPTGPLSDAGRVLSGEQDLRFAAADLGGGLAHVALFVDGVMQKEQPITPAGSGCREPYVEPVPCPLTNDGGISFDTATVADGPHSVALALIDAAGNRTVSRAVSVVFRNRPLANGVGATRAAKLRTWFRVNGRSRASRTVSFGKRARLHGTLETAVGAPIAGAVIEVSSTPRELGAGRRELASITTDERGRFSFTPVAGSSRRITLAYRPFESDPTPATTAAVTLSVRRA